MATIVTIAQTGDPNVPCFAAGPFAYGSSLFGFTCEAAYPATANPHAILVYESTDGGATWALAVTGPTVFQGTVYLNSSFDACVDGDSVWVVFQQPTSSLVSVSEFDMVTKTFGTAIDSSDQAMGGVGYVFTAAGTVSLSCALIAAGSFAVIYPQIIEVTPGAWTYRGRTMIFASGAWGSPQWVNTVNSNGLNMAIAANSARIHLFVFDSISQQYKHTPMSTAGVLGSTTSVTGTATNGYPMRPISWTYLSIKYVALAVSDNSAKTLRVVVAVSADSPSWTSRLVFTAPSGYFASHDCTTALVPIAASLHVVFCWWRFSALGAEVYKSCAAYLDPLGTFSTPTLLHARALGQGLSHVSGYALGDEGRFLLSTGFAVATGGDQYLLYLQETLTACAADGCCCYDFAY